MYQQVYNPLGNAFLSTLVAAIPILTLLYFIALHPRRDAQGNVHLGISAPYAAFFGVIAAFLISCLVFSMPWPAAASAFALGTPVGFPGDHLDRAVSDAALHDESSDRQVRDREGVDGLHLVR
jgi:lactate permease